MKQDDDFIVMWLLGFVFIVILVFGSLYLFGNAITTKAVEYSEPLSKVIK